MAKMVNLIPRNNKRLGIDLDTKNQFRLLKTYYNAANLNIGKIIIFETKHGYHIVIKLKRNLPEKTKMHIRHLLNDDPERLTYDYLKQTLHLNTFIDTLFFIKKDENGKITTTEQINNLTAKPFSSKTKPKKLFRFS